MCPSSDAYAIYEGSGVGICFSCGGRMKPDGAAVDAAPSGQPLVYNIDYIPLDTRDISQAVCQKYGYGVGEMFGKKCQVAPYYNDRGQLVAQKVRFAGKDFTVTGDLTKATLFGMQLARAGGKMIVITEGEIDALAACDALGMSWPAVSVPTGAAGALGALKQNLEFLETYEKIVLAFDSDEEGRKATDACLDLFAPGKACVADLGGFKDPGEMLQARGKKELRDALWSAKVYRPDGVINLADIKERIKKKLEMGRPYPWAGLNGMLYGQHAQEMITWCAGTGAGKTTIVSEILYDLVAVQEQKVGIIYLEEGPDRAGKRVISIAMNKPIHLPGVEYTDAEFEAAWDKSIGTRRIEAYDHFGSLDEDVLIGRIRYMVKALGCMTIILDHVSLVVSGNDLEQDERRTLDKIMTTLRSLTQETNATFHIISHLKRADGKPIENGGKITLSLLRGSQSIAQLSDMVIAAERDSQADDLTERNTIYLRVLKNRYAGKTGPAGKLVYNEETGRLTDLWDAEDATPDIDDPSKDF
jgi:twinkle protein